MSFQIIPQAESPLVSTLKGVGQGFSEQLPKEVERHRLSQGLKGLVGKTNLTPFEQLAEVSAIPGMTPQMAQVALQYLQTNLAKREAEGAQGTAQSQATGEPKTAEEKAIARKQSKYKTIEDMTPEEIKTEGSRLSRMSPNLYPNQAAGEAEAQKRSDARVKQRSDFENDFDRTLGELTHRNKGETYGQVLGELQNDFRQRGIDAIANGTMKPAQAAKHFAKEGLDFAKNRQNLITLGAQNMVAKSPKDVRSTLEEIQKTYEKNGMGEAYVNDLKTHHGLTNNTAPEIAKPVEKDKPVSDELAKVKAPSLVKYNMKGQKKQFDTEEDIAKKLVPKINPKSSLLAIASNLKDKGFDGNKFLAEMRNLKETDNDFQERITEQQANELKQNLPAMKSLEDFFLTSMLGKFIPGVGGIPLLLYSKLK